MAKSHKVKKGSKARAKTSLPPVKESYMKNGTKNQRAVSISPTFQPKTLRKLAPRKKTKIKPKEKYVAPLPKSISASQACNTSSYSAAFVDSFSKLSVTDRKPLNNSQRYSMRSFSTDGNGTGKSRFSSLEDVTRLISAGRAKNIVVMAGAGISTASGIPDFRTPGTGLYDNLQSYRIPSPTAIFDLDYFFHDPKPFFALAKELYPSGKYQPCHAHHFVRLLHEKGILLRMYTQNIDGLERIAGIPPEKLVEAHGTFATASCVRCNKKYDGEEIKQRILSGVIPRCKSTALCWGIIKPDIVFFGEDLPRRFYYYLKDFPACDLLIIMGTSLEVEPFASLTNSVRSSTPRLLMNMELVGPFAKSGLRRPYDISVTGDLTHSVKKFTHLLGWKVDLKSLIMVNKNLEGVENDQEKSESNSSDSGHIPSLSYAVSPSESSGSNKKEVKPLRKPNSDIKRYYSSLPLVKSSVHSQSSYTGYGNTSSYYSYIKDRNSGLTPNATTYSVVKNGKPPRSISYGRVKVDSAITIHYARTVRQKRGAKLNFSAISSTENCVPNLSSNSDSFGESRSESTDSDSKDITSSDDSYT